MQKIVLVATSFLCVVTLSLVLALVFWHFNDRSQIIDKARTLAQDKARIAAGDIETSFASASAGPGRATSDDVTTTMSAAPARIAGRSHLRSITAVSLRR